MRSAPGWAEGTGHAEGNQVTYGGRLYRARVAHTPPAGAGWTPVAAASLWEDLGACDGTPPSLSTMVSSGNLKNVTLAFITASACKAMWFNAYDPRQGWARDRSTPSGPAAGT
ncbi:carbohydrate-binding protein [Actinoplanes sp. NPDC049596]|uniref:carbohydrate-binding protein n=1 Tax=Actinoplanes sp. NPDC049596 TaxID=3154625 RepID=UPI0034339E99